MIEAMRMLMMMTISDAKQISDLDYEDDIAAALIPVRQFNVFFG